MSPIEFLLERHKGNREEYYRAYLVACFGLIEIIISTSYFFIHPHFEFQVPRYVFTMLAIVVVILLLLLRWRIPISALAHSLIGTLWASFCVGIATSGGIVSLVVPWLAVMPVMANLLINQQAARLWLGISLSSMLFFFASGVFSGTTDNKMWRSVAANSGLVVITYSFTWLFHRAQMQLLSKVKSRNKRLEDRKNRLVSQHREIEAQQSHILKQNQLLQSQNKNIDNINQLLQLRVQEIVSRNEMLRQHWQTLLSITKSYTVHYAQLEEALAYITETVAKSLAIDRVGIWRYNPSTNKIVCLHLTDISNPNQQPEKDLSLEDFPRYFNALLLEEVIQAGQAQLHTHTYELKEKYLVPRKIVSMMDSPFFISGKLGGVICCEHRQERPWANEDILFVQALSDIVTVSIMNQERRAYEATLLEKQSEIIQINESLETRVKQRTEELEKQNHQLAEYAYINSHLLRAPLSRLLGLVNLVRYSEIAGTEREQIIQQIQVAGSELDEVVAKINQALGVKSSFNRSIFD